MRNQKKNRDRVVILIPPKIKHAHDRLETDCTTHDKMPGPVPLAKRSTKKR